MELANEARELIQKIMDNPEMVEKLNLFLKTKNGIVVRYKFDRRKIEKQKQNREMKQLKEESKEK